MNNACLRELNQSCMHAWWRVRHREMGIWPGEKVKPILKNYPRRASISSAMDQENSGIFARMVDWTGLCWYAGLGTSLLTFVDQMNAPHSWKPSPSKLKAWSTAEVPHFADYRYGYVLAIWKVGTYSQSSARPDFSDYGYGYVKHGFDSQKHAAAQSVFWYSQLRVNRAQYVVSGSTLRIDSRHFFSTYSEPYFVRNLPSVEPL